MGRRAAVLFLFAGALLLTPGAPGGPDVPGDPTPPNVVPVITGTLGSNGWYTTNVGVSWSITDPESIILSTSGCDTASLPGDTTGITLVCSAESDGGTTTVTKTFKIDKTAPVSSATAARSADSNGWYNHSLDVSFSGSDATSGLDSCSPPATYAGPDNGNASVSGTCKDKAGNTATPSLSLKYDSTKPQASPSARATDKNGWYNHSVTVNYLGADATSGIDSCTQTTYSGPDDPSTAVGGTCTDKAGNQSGSSLFTLKYDETAPQASATASRGPDVNAWYNHDLTVSFSGSDATSGLDICDAPATYSGPDSTNAVVSGTCRDFAGNTITRSLALKYDETAPQATATPDRQPNAKGWYRAGVTVTFAGTDATSGLASCVAPKDYSGPDSANASVGGTCLDQAGNVGSTSFGLKYDATAPLTTPSPSRQPNANGWFNASLAVSFAGTDATAGIDSCDAPKTYAGPDTLSTAVTGACRDNAGNSGPGSYTLKYDGTNPSVTAAAARQPNANGWYNASVGVNFTGGDATSGIDSCDASKTYAGPDNANASLAGDCHDKAGNSGTGSLSLKYDATAPVSTATPDRQPNANSWYRAPVTVTFGGADATSGLDSCDAAKTYSGPDTQSHTLSGACLDKAGNSSAASRTLKYDATAPVSTATPDHQPNASDWFNAPLTVNFAATDAMSGFDVCDPAKSYSGPDSASASVSGTCTDKAGNTGSAAYGLKYDATAPQATATPSRPADKNGWYNHSLTVSFAATDATSGLQSCPADTSYSGPDATTTSVNGTCFDKAGNGGLASLTLKYDATAPATTATPDRQPNANGWYKAAVTVTFAGSDTTAGIDSCDAAKTYAGPDTQSTSVSGDCRDKAGNASSAAKTIKYDATAPVTTATPDHQPNANGWFKSALSVAFAATDAMSTVESCDAAKSYSGPDSAAASVTGSCLDKAGNVGPASYALKYDATAPVTTATPDRQPNANGWYRASVTVTFGGTDATAGIDSCDQPKSYAGPDTTSTTLSGACLDKAGNSSSASRTMKYDATAPVTTATPDHQPNANGWFRSALSVAFAATDATSTVDSCDAARSYSGPDSASASVTGTCLDKAGNVGAASYGLKYDATAPATTATPDRQPNANGWYRASVTVTFAGTDVTSDIDSCDPAQSYAGPDTASTTLSGACRDKAGNESSASRTLKYDATAPATTATPDRQPNANGWYKAAVTVTFAGSDATAGIDSCDAAKTYAGPDTQSTSVSGDCRDKAGNASSAAKTIKYDATAPVTTATPDHQPNANGWFRSALSVAFAATDAMSTVESCDAAKSYSGPDSAAASLTGSCLDKAGNVGPASYALKYDATAPVTTATPDRQPNANGWYRSAVTVAFTATDAMSTVDSCDGAKSYSGPDSATASLDGACRDKAGNSDTGSLALKYDGTAPATTATSSPQPNVSGWNKSTVTVTFAGTDATAGIDSCDAAKTYSGPDTQSTTLSGDCRDKAGNATSASRTLKYDATAPQSTATPSRQPNANGWYRAPLSVAFAATDAMSGFDACDPAKSYSGPDSATAAVGGTCLDKAGNAGPTSYAFKYDATAPQASTTPSRQPNADGWFNASVIVSFAATDALSGLESCPAAQSYGGPDTVSAVVSGTCLDKAGNGGLASYGFKYDATAPVATATADPQPNTAGWNKSNVTVTFAGADATAGIESCDAAKSYSGPDTQSTTVSGTCKDKAGNTDAASRTLKYDATAPVVTDAVPRRAADRAGWYNHAVEVDAVGSDAMSGLSGPCTSVTYSGPDGNNVPISGQCVDVAGNTGFQWFAIDYDDTGPETAATPSRSPDVNGWYNQALTVSFTGSDSVSGLDSCAAPENYSGPDSGMAVVGGICVDKAGNAGVGSYALQFDATPPQVTGASPARQPDSNGWYNQPLDVRFQGTDATSAIESCSQARYAGPDAGAASVSGFCHDRAGNRSADSSFALKYDTTAPSLTGVTAKAGDKKAVLTWTASPDTTLVEIHRADTLVYRGHEESFTDTGLKNGVRYRYTLTGYDEAHNGATSSTGVTPTAPLVSPAAGAVVKAPPRLAWNRVAKATYYNVQVWRSGRIFSSWPTGTSIKLKRSWVYNGRRYRLTPGKYRWYVWPGYGKRTGKKFGPLLGSSSFVVRAR